MKAATTRRSYTACCRSRRPASSPYPNAADRRYYLDKLLDIALGIAICLSAVVILLFLMVL